MSDVGRLPLGLQMLRGAGIFQAIIAFPVCLFMGFAAFRSVLEPWEFMLYYFMVDTFTSIAAAGIIFSVYVQRKATITAYQYLIFESTKSVLATGLWIWLIADAAAGPWIGQCKKQQYWSCNPGPRVTRSSLSLIVLFVFFYPPLVYSYLVWRKSDDEEESLEGDARERGVTSERSPLLP